MIELDHICLAAQNVYEATFRLSRETGFGNYDGGFFPLYGLGHKVVPLSSDVYIEVEGIVDYVQLYNANPVTKLYERVTLAGDCFLGLCFRASTMEEMECFAAHQGTTVDTKTLNVDTARQMMNGNRGLAIQVPSALKAWPAGMPNLYYKPELSNHPASVPVEKDTGHSTPGGVEWIEIGEDENQLSSWFGDVVRPMDLNVEIRYNGQSPGLYAMGIKSDSGLIEIRRRPPTR